MTVGRVGAIVWAVQPLYIGLELLAVAMVLAPDTLTVFGTDTISSLGTAGSPGHVVANASFVVFGLLRLVGALLVRRRLPRGRVATVAVGLWVVAGASAIATGFVPVDVDRPAHLLVAAPVLVAQPLALLLVGLALRDRVAVAAGALSAVAALVFAAGLVPGAGGGFERLALWPGYVWLGVVGIRLLRAPAA